MSDAPKSPPTVLVVDDDEVDRMVISRALASDHALTEATSAKTANEHLRAASFDCVLIDLRLPDSSGLDLIEAALAVGSPVIMMTGRGTELLAVEAMKRGASDYLIKDQGLPEALRRAVSGAVERARLQRALDASHRAVIDRERQLSVVLAQLPAILWTCDPTLHCTAISGAALARLGLTPEMCVGRPITEIVALAGGSPEVLEAHRAALSGKSSGFERHNSGRTWTCHTEPLQLPDDRLGVIGMALDVTESRELERQLRHSQKMEAMGKLAGGVAHDFNNLLTGIVAFTTFARDAVVGTPVEEDLLEVLRASERARELVRQLLAFARRTPVAPTLLDVRQTIDAVVPMLRRVVGEQVSLRVAYPSTEVTVRMDPGGLDQILMNLVVNARDAMPEGGVVDIEVTTEAEPSECVVITVGDHGVGISPAVLERVLEPFFTTKSAGTGLGLSTCYGIVRSAGGVLSVESVLGRGTTVRVALPRAAPEAPREAPQPEAPLRSPGGESILLVEDDEHARPAIRRMLAGLGYDVLVASGPEEARALLAEGRKVDVVVSDVVLPGLSGPALLAELRVLRPGLRALFVSGYAPESLADRGVLSTGDLLEKPFSPAVLAARVRSVLDR